LIETGDGLGLRFGLVDFSVVFFFAALTTRRS
jgi:hypothetical protein